MRYAVCLLWEHFTWSRNPSGFRDIAPAACDAGEARLIAAEDTRSTAKLLPTLACTPDGHYHEHNKLSRLAVGAGGAEKAMSTLDRMQAPA